MAAISCLRCLITLCYKLQRRWDSLKLRSSLTRGPPRDGEIKKEEEDATASSKSSRNKMAKACYEKKSSLGLLCDSAPHRRKCWKRKKRIEPSCQKLSKEELETKNSGLKNKRQNQKVGVTKGNVDWITSEAVCCHLVWQTRLIFRRYCGRQLCEKLIRLQWRRQRRWRQRRRRRRRRQQWRWRNERQPK